MREIRFRGWTKDKGMVYNLGIKPGTHDQYTMQFTGQKDKNGKDCYEFDVVQDINGNLGRIRFEQEHAAFMITYNHTRLPFFMGNGLTPFEVIGNIFEDPQLLEE